jgi:hypothetical protein
MRRHLPILLLILLGCRPMLEVPEQAMILCADQGDCPGDRECRAAIGRCVPLGSEDEPPSASGTVRPSVLGAGRATRLDVTASEPLDRPPVIRLLFAAPVDMSLLAAAGETYAFGYTPSGPSLFFSKIARAMATPRASTPS